MAASLDFTATEMADDLEENESKPKVSTEPEICKAQAPVDSKPSTPVKPQPAPRDLLIATAVHFLQNPRVQKSSITHKRAFLLKKGLTQTEVDLALDRVAMPVPYNSSNGGGLQLPPPIPGHVEAQSMVSWQPGSQENVPSLWLKWRELCSSVMVVGATCYGFYYLYKQYLEPALIGKKQEEEDRLGRVERHLLELNKSLSQLRHTLAAVETTLTKQSAIADSRHQLEAQADSDVQDIISLAEIKSEMASIKALLLSRKQFPATPASSAIIPAWQMEQQQNSNTNEDKENPSTEDTVPKQIIEASPDLKKVLSNGVTVNGDSATTEDD